MSFFEVKDNYLQSRILHQQRYVQDLVLVRTVQPILEYLRIKISYNVYSVAWTQISILVNFNIFAMTEKCTIYIVHE